MSYLQYLVMHRTWKNQCVPITTVEAVKSWYKLHNNVYTIFWTDDAILGWFKTYYTGTPVEKVNNNNYYCYYHNNSDDSDNSNGNNSK